MLIDSAFFWVDKNMKICYLLIFGIRSHPTDIYRHSPSAQLWRTRGGGVRNESGKETE